MHVLKAQNKPWRCVKSSDGVFVFSRKSDSSGIKIIKVETRIKTSLSALVAVVKDASNHNKWVYLNKDAKIIRSSSPFSWDYYGQTNAPWPVTDRDIVVHGSLHQDSVTKVIHINARTESGYIPLKKGFVRIPFAVSQWIFVPEDSGYVHVEFKVEINLGGNIPKWLMNLTASRGPYETICQFKELTKTNKYQHIHLSYIHE